MKIFHIIETYTADQQTVEIKAKNANDAICTYMKYATIGQTPDHIEVCGNGKIIWHYADEYCVLQAWTPQIVFAKWTHRRGLY